MSTLFEVVFEVSDAETARALALLQDLVSQIGRVRNCHLDDGLPVATADLIGRLSMTHWTVALISSDSLGLPTFGSLSEPTLRLLRTPDGVDVELLVDLTAIQRRTEFGDALIAFARELAQRHGISTYYGGLEPARDRDTRLFTGTSRGPLNLRG